MLGISACKARKNVLPVLFICNFIVKATKTRFQEPVHFTHQFDSEDASRKNIYLKVIGLCNRGTMTAPLQLNVQKFR